MAAFLLVACYLLVAVGVTICVFDGNMKSWKDGDATATWWAYPLVAAVSFGTAIAWPFWLYLWWTNKKSAKAPVG